MNQTASVLEDLWFRHKVVYRPRGRHTATGPKPGDPVRLQASINGQAVTVTNQRGEEVVAAATLHWPKDGPVPTPGDTVDLPPGFGLKPGREVVTARLADSGTGLTPAHVEVTIR